MYWRGGLEEGEEIELGEGAVRYYHYHSCLLLPFLLYLYLMYVMLLPQSKVKGTIWTDIDDTKVGLCDF